ncbi:hypothetical protein [Humibacter sp.]|jgi:hypothetical protein|uniref:hypothetical protein n=1 Tax=Humibacter sp. TaxID=1940291 RepID=UPI003F81C8BF
MAAMADGVGRDDDRARRSDLEDGARGFVVDAAPAPLIGAIDFSRSDLFDALSRRLVELAEREPSEHGDVLIACG